MEVLHCWINDFEMDPCCTVMEWWSCSVREMYSWHENAAEDL